MSNQQILKDLHSAISSQELEDGQEPCRLQGGVQTDLFGQEALPANLLVQQEAEKERTTSDTSGLSSLISSESANLQRSLESRLRQLSDLGGSTIYKLTLRKKVTPQGRSYFHLVASAPRTKEIASSSWPTPKAKEVAEDYDQYIKRMKSSKHAKNRGKTEPASVSMAAQLTPWLTPTTSDMNGVRELDGKRSGGLNTQVQSAWPTPLASDQRGSAGVGKKELPNIAKLAAPWPTPRAHDTHNLNNSEKVVQGRVENGRATVAEIVTHNTSAWATPTATDPSRGTKPPRPQDTGIPLTQQVSGLTQEKSTAETENPVASQLNPRFSLWLMGYPIEWAYSGERVTPLSRKQQQK